MTAGPPLRAAVVVRSGPDACRVVAGGASAGAGYGEPFRPRAAELRPGHLVALAPGPAGAELVVWRWFDGVVVEAQDGLVRLWEPAHGEVLARPRRPERPCLPGSRWWLSAGLPGAEWWVAGPAEGLEVELDEVGRFYAEHGLWERLA